VEGLMEFTGERVVPGQTDPDLLNEHLARYAFAERLVGSKRVLDAGCGVPYGAALLARSAAQVFALDNSFQPLREGRAEYPGNVAYLQGDCSSIPLADASVEVVVAFEVIEHLENWRGLIEEARRILTPGGQFVVSTPNRLYYGETRETPNRFHVHEFAYEEFQAELSRVFSNTALFLQNHTDAIAFSPLDTRGVKIRLEHGEPRPAEAHFFVAVCSQQPLYGSPAFIYIPQTGNVLRDREHHIDLLEAELLQKTRWLEQTAAELEKLAKVNKAEQEKAQRAIDELEQENERKTKWAGDLETKLDERTKWSIQLEAENQEVVANYQRLEEEHRRAQAELKKCVDLLDRAEQTVVERTEWAQRLTRDLEALYASPAYRFGRRLGLAPNPPAAAANSGAGSTKS
jgi:SAM-dependent methyltransferase